MKQDSKLHGFEEWEEIEFLNTDGGFAVVKFEDCIQLIPGSYLRTQPNNDLEFQVNPAFNPGIKIPPEYIQK